MKRYCITGVSGYLGGLLAKRLLDSQNNVTGVDLKAPKPYPGLVSHSLDICSSEFGELLKREQIETLIHLAFYTAPEGDAKLARTVNVEGTRNVLAAAKEAGVKRVVLASSAAAYGSHEDNPIPMSENDPLRPNDFFYYSAHKAEQERMIQTLAQEAPDMQFVILRPCVVIGPHINNPTGDSLKQKLLINFKKPMIPIQLIYEDDVAEAFYLAATQEPTGVFNVAGEGLLDYREIGRLMKKKVLFLPYRVLCWLASFGKLVGLSPVSGRTLEFIKNPIVINGEKFNKAFNFKPKYNAEEALMQFANSIGQPL